MNITRTRALVAGIALCWSATGMAAVETYVTNIDRLLTEHERFGQCMVYTKETPTIDCPANWFSMDCKGSFNSKETTRRLWDSAQLAYATESRVVIVLTDQQKHNGYCVVLRMDVLR